MHRFYSTIFAVAGMCLFLLTGQSYCLSNFSNYQAVIRINALATAGKKIWAASSGGLLMIDREKNTQTFFSDSYLFPDLNMTALALDSKGNVWIGSGAGYLYKRSPDGRITTFTSYSGAQWSITALKAYRDYLIVGASKGIGIFDPQTGISIRNASIVDSSGSASVNAIALHNDSLYIGCQESFNAFDISGNNFLGGNYLDATQWSMVATNSPIVSFVDSGGALEPKTTQALIVGQTVYQCDMAKDSVTTISADSLEIKLPTTEVTADSTPVFKVPGSVTRMISDETNNIWVGTDENFLFRWNGTTLKQYKIEGLTQNTTKRIYAAKNGTVWILPEVTSPPDKWTPQWSTPQWWEGITAFDGKQWNLYNRFSVSGLGIFGGGGSDFLGICEDHNGNMWFGTTGANVKVYNVQKKQWISYQFSGYAFDSIKQLSTIEVIYNSFWGQHNAIAQDSFGLMWVANSFIGSIGNGCLICYDPAKIKTPSYRRFFQKSDPNSNANIRSLCADDRGHILVGGLDGRLQVLATSANSIDSGVQVIMDRKDLGQPITEMSATPGGITWIAAGGGLYKYTSTFSPSDTALKHISSIKGAISSVAAETPSIIWLGTSDKGLIRYDAEKDSAKTIDMTSGLVSNAVNDLSIDKANGFLWVGTPDGLSRYSLGHTAVAVTDNASISAYPNPYSLSNPNHREIVFKHCASGAKINIYAVNGSLVKTLTAGKDDAYSSDENSFESTLHWIPSKKMPPGTYYFIGQSQKPVKTKKLMILP